MPLRPWRDRKREPRVPTLRRVLGAELPVRFQTEVSLYLTDRKPNAKLRTYAEDSRPETANGVTKPAIAPNLLVHIPGNASGDMLR